MYEYSYNTSKCYKHIKNSVVKAKKTSAQIIVEIRVKNGGMQNVLNSEITSTKTVVPTPFFVPLNWYGRPKIKSRFFRKRFVKRLQNQAAKCISSQSRYFEFYNLTGRAPSHVEVHSRTQ